MNSSAFENSSTSSMVTDIGSPTKFVKDRSNFGSPSSVVLFSKATIILGLAKNVRIYS